MARPALPDHAVRYLIKKYSRDPGHVDIGLKRF